MSNIYDAMRRDLESAMANLSRPNAAELRRLRRVNAELLGALKLAQSIIGHPEDAHSKLISAAIAKAEEVKP